MKFLLEALKNPAAPRPTGAHVRIWSREVRGWWRPTAAGYTDQVGEAGIWPFEEAWAMTSDCGPEKGIEYEVADIKARKPLDQRLAKLSRKLAGDGWHAEARRVDGMVEEVCALQKKLDVAIDLIEAVEATARLKEKEHLHEESTAGAGYPIGLAKGKWCAFGAIRRLVEKHPFSQKEGA